MKRHRILAALAALAVAPTAVLAQAPTLSFNPSAPIQLGTPIQVVVQGTAGDIAFVVIGAERETFPTSFGVLEVNPFTSTLFGVGFLPANGVLQFNCGPALCDFAMTQDVFYTQAVTFQSAGVARGISPLVPVDFVTGDACAACVTEAPVDTSIWTCTKYLTAFYMPGCASDRFDWVAPGTFAEYGDSTARLTGEIKDINDPNKGFCVELVFSGRVSIATNDGTYPPTGSPKLDCFLAGALVEFGGPVDTSEWHYYTDIKGTFTGKNDFAGTNYDVTLEGPAAQIGFGGALKNADYGLSAWLLFTRTSGMSCDEEIHGDINVNLKAKCL